MEIEIREYDSNDYAACEELVNQAWGFDDTYKPARFAALAKKIYTKGSELESNYRSVAISDGKVLGFIFGLNELRRSRRLHLKFRFQVLWEFLRVKTSLKPNKRDLLESLGEHEKNRSAFVGKKRSELVLFVISASCQKGGIGTKLWNGFMRDCQKSGVSKIVVETNALGAAGFYEKIGFRHVADFYSPLHEMATPGGQACIYEFGIENYS